MRALPHVTTSKMRGIVSARQVRGKDASYSLRHLRLHEMGGGRKNPRNVVGNVRPRAAQGLDPAPPSTGAPGSAFSCLMGPWAGRAGRPRGTHTGWEHSCGLQARRMALGFVRASQKPRCTILWSSLRRQPYLVNWEPEDESSRGLMGQVRPPGGVEKQLQPHSA